MLKKLSWQLSLFLLGVSLVMVVAADKDGYDDEGKTKIINGAPVDEAHKYPFMAYIRSGRDLNMLRIPMCGASIIDAQWILSGKRCSGESARTKQYTNVFVVFSRSLFSQSFLRRLAKGGRRLGQPHGGDRGGRREGVCP